MKALKIIAFAGLVALVGVGLFHNAEAQLPQSYNGVDVNDWTVEDDSTNDSTFHVGNADLDTSDTYNAFLWDRIALECWREIECDTCHAARRDSSDVTVYLVGSNYNNRRWVLVDSIAITDTVTNTKFVDAAWPGYRYAAFIVRGLVVTLSASALPAIQPSVWIRVCRKGVK
ncbi:MAG: hypothetical protein AB1752_11620 [Candidatus Zixiibacteriota bacterium]